MIYGRSKVYTMAVSKNVPKGKRTRAAAYAKLLWNERYGMHRIIANLKLDYRQGIV